MAARFAQSWDVTEQDIKRLCFITTDDDVVAGYFGIALDRVAHVRAKIAKRPAYLRTGQDVTSEETINASTQKTDAAAEEGSAQLLERCNMLFRKYGKKQGIPWGDALVVQQFGWAVLNRLRASQA